MTMRATPPFAASILLFFLLIASHSPISAQTHKTMEIVELATNATTVVRGEIKEVKGSNLVLSVEYCLVGDVGSEVTVKRFKNTKVAKRWGKYEAGQKLLLFLQGEPGAWKIMGVNGEGEKYVLGDDVLLDGRGGGVKNRYSYINLTGGRIYAEKVPLDEFEEAVTGLRKNFKVTYDAVEDVTGETYLYPRASVLVDEKELEDFKYTTETTLSLVEKSMKLVK